MRIFLLLFTILAFLLDAIGAEIKYDSLSWYSKDKLQFASWTTSGIQHSYHFYSNGHVQDITRTTSGKLLTRYEFFPNGERKFDTICTENYYNWSWTYYPNGARKRYVQEQFWSSYSQTHTRFQLIEWDEGGDVSHLLEKDEQNNVVADEIYPFKKYRNVKLHQVFDTKGQLVEHGFYTENPFDGSRIKQGCDVTFFGNGKLKTIGLFIDNKPFGIHYEYTENGTLLSMKNYSNGKEIGFAADNLATDIYGPANINYPSWRWKNFTTEGLSTQFTTNDTILNYFFRGVVVVAVNTLSKCKQNQLNQEFGFPVSPYWGTYTQYRVEFGKSKIVREHEMLNGSWVTNRIYNESNNLIWAYNCSTRQNTVYNANGTLLTRESPYRSDEVRTPSGFLFYGGMNDSTITFASNGTIATTVVYGLYGQKYCSNIYSNGKIVSSEKSPIYCRLFVTVARGKTIEVLDEDVLLPGYYVMKTASNKIHSQGRIESLKDGLWIEYDLETGRKKTVQYYNQGLPKAKGHYEEYYSNGQPHTKGTYGDNQEQVGVWKTYNSEGRLDTRIRYKNGVAKGVEYCSSCCPHKRGHFRWQITLHLRKKQIRLKKCRSRYEPTYPD